MIMEAEKSHPLLSISWRTRKASGIIQSKPKGPRKGVGLLDGSKSQAELRMRSVMPEGRRR